MHELWKWTRVPLWSVVQCLYHVSCVRIVGFSFSSTPLVGSDIQHCVCCLLGLRMPRISRSLACVALLASELPLDCPLHVVPSVCASHTLDEATVPDFLIVLCLGRSCCVHTQCCSDDVLVALCGSSMPNTCNESGIEFAAFGFLVSDFRINS